MKELSQLLIKAKEVKTYVDVSEFETLIEKIKEIKEYRMDWEADAGEEWARFLNFNSEIVLMMNIRIGVAFLREDCFSEKIVSILNDLFLVKVENFGSDQWCIDLSEIRKALPEISWAASEEAVNTEKMSLQDLYYATV